MARFIAAIVFATVALIGAPAHAAPSEIRPPAGPLALPPCLHEGGSGQRACVWDARHRGNGQGQSLIIRTSTGEYTSSTSVQRISHRRAHRIVKRWRNQHCQQDVADPFAYACRGWNRA